MNDLEERIAALEEQFEKLTALNGIPGPQGKPGNIQAAVAGAERVVKAQLAELHSLGDERTIQQNARIETIYKDFREELDRFRNEVRKMVDQSREEMRAHFKTNALKNAFENITVQILHEYGVVSSHDNRVIGSDDDDDYVFGSKS